MSGGEESRVDAGAGMNLQDAVRSDLMAWVDEETNPEQQVERVVHSLQGTLARAVVETADGPLQWELAAPGELVTTFPNGARRVRTFSLAG